MMTSTTEDLPEAAGAPKLIRPTLHSLPQIGDRMTFIYLERCRIHREDNAITAQDERGTVRIPAAAVSVLLLGPGSNVTHRAMELIGDAGVSIVWVGEHGVRYYASGRPLTSSSRLLMRQAELVVHQRQHLQVARAMYAMRFPNEDVSALTMQQLRGREGSRIRAVYRREAKKWNVQWDGREYDPNDFEASNSVNQALSAAHACLYGLAHAVIAALGCSPALGFVHVGHERSFVYDIADLYKADITIPASFEIASDPPADLPGAVRRRVRDLIVEHHVLERMVRDIKYLLNEDSREESADNILYLWDMDELAGSGIAWYDEERADTL